MSSLKFRWFRRKHRRAQKSVLVDTVPSPVVAKVQSLGSGTFSSDGMALVDFLPNHSKTVCGESTTATGTLTTYENHDISMEDLDGNRLLHLRSMINSGKVMDNIEHISGRITERLQQSVSFKRLSSSFIRVADLQMTHRTVGSDSEESCPNFHHASQDPPPGIDHDPQEEWVALDDGAGSHAPIAPYALAALASFGLKTAMDQSMWRCEGKTDRFLKNSAWKDIVWQENGPVRLPTDFPESEEVMIWSGNFIHGHYGSDLPAIRSTGVVNMSPKALTDLLVDSSRTKEYNKMSVGRTDLLVLQDNLYEDGPEGPFGKSITKVMRAETLPPMLRKSLKFVTILHATELEDGCGYLLVSRAVTRSSEVEAGGGFDALHSEILMGVNVIRRVEGHDDRCFMITVNHIRTPMVPLFLGKKLGLAAAPNFIYDLRSLC